MYSSKIIALLLLFLMSFQVLPIAQIGNMLSKGLLTEELPHTTDDAEKDEGSFFKKNYSLNHEYPTLTSADLARYTATGPYIQDAIPSNHSAEVVCPPPDGWPVYKSSLFI